MTPILSVIIPCYNSGKYLPEAIESVTSYKGSIAYEIIIVNDGSTDGFTLSLLQKLSGEGFTVLHRENGGPAAARNTGVKHSACEYILFLDSDNRIRSEYMDVGVQVLKARKDVGVVFGNASFFGETDQPRFVTGEFDRFSIFKSNYIDICAVIRKQAWQSVGGLDENRLLMGHEDWEFWIHLSSKDWKFHYVPQTLFDYRVRDNSLLLQKSDESNVKKVISYVYTKHWDLFLQYHSQLYTYFLYYSHDRKNPFRTFIKYLYYKYFRKSKQLIRE